MRTVLPARGAYKPRSAMVAGLIAAMALAGCASTGQRAERIAAERRAACGNVDFPIYFEKGSDQLTGSARQTLGYAAAQVKGCRIGEVEVLGLADADAAAGQAMDLSRRRANMVAQALAATGLPAPVFDIAALGKLGARSRSGAPAPLHRRAEVIIHAAPQ